MTTVSFPYNDDTVDVFKYTYNSRFIACTVCEISIFLTIIIEKLINKFFFIYSIRKSLIIAMDQLPEVV